MQERATHGEQVAIGEEPPRAEPSAVAPRTVAAAEVPDPVGVPVGDELEVPSRHRAVAEADRAGPGAPDLHARTRQEEEGAGIHARDADQRRGCRGDRRASGLEQGSDQGEGAGYLGGRLDPQLRLARQANSLPGEEPAPDSGIEHRPPHENRPGTSHPDAVRLEFQVEEPGRQSAEPDAVVIAPSDRPGAWLQLELGLDPACLEADVHPQGHSQSSCQGAPSTE